MPIVQGGTRLLDVVDVLENQLQLAAGHQYADLGVGSAMHLIFPAAKIVGEGGKAYALDIQKGLLGGVKSTARQEGFTNVETVWTDLEIYGAAKAIPNDTLDRLTMVNLLYQTKQDQHVINEANRMLKPGGMVVVLDWLPTGATFGPPESERTSLATVRQLAKVVGWREVHSFQPGPYHFGVVFTK